MGSWEEELILRQLREMERRLTKKLEKIMTAQQDIDAAVQAIQTAVGVVETETSNLSDAVAAIQAFIAANPNADTSQLDAAVTTIKGSTDSLTSAVQGAQNVLPQNPTPPAGS